MSLQFAYPQIIIAGELDSTDTKALLSVVNLFYLPNKVLIVHRPGSKSFLTEHLETLNMFGQADDGKAFAIVCENNTCGAPVCDPDQLKKMLKPGISF